MERADGIDIHREYHGETLSWWVRLPSEPSRCCGHVADTSEDEAIGIATRWAQNAHEDERKDAMLRARYPGYTLYHGPLPCNDVTWEGVPGSYTYVLKDRRRHGKHQVLAVVE